MTAVGILVNLLMIAFVTSLAWRKLATSDSLVFWSAAALRLLAGISLGVLYKYYYGGGDTFSLFNSALEFASNDDFVVPEPRSFFFVYMISLINIITAGNYWVTSLWFSIFSFLCSYRLVAKLDEVFPSLRMTSRIALLFLPSVVFWTSGIIKESLGFGAVAILVLYFLSFMNNEKLTWRSFVEIVIALVLLFNLKYYWAAVLIPSLLTAVIIKKIEPKKLLGVWFLGVFVLLCLAASFTHPNFHLDRFLQVLVENHDIYVVRYPENLIKYNDLAPEWSSILVNSPLALWSGLFRPTVFEISSAAEAVAALENLLILILFAWKIFKLRMPAPKNRLVVFTVIVYVIVLCVFLTLSTPNLGTLSRYRVGFLSFFVLLILADHPIFNFINGKPGNHIRS